jgi:hypothetical protein
MYHGVWHRILHDQTAEALSREISKLPHANVTTVPFHFEEPAVCDTTPSVAGNGHRNSNGKAKHAAGLGTAPAAGTDSTDGTDGTVPIGEVAWRQRVRVGGRVRAVRVEPLAGNPSVEYTLADSTGAISLVFYGRREVAGITIGTSMLVEGMTIDHHGRLAIVNPAYELRSREESYIQT